MNYFRIAHGEPGECLKTWHIVLLMLLLAFVGYGSALNNFFFQDDTSGPYAGYILSHKPWRLFSENFDVIYMSRLWRLVVSLSYVPNYLWTGLDPWSYYLVNILLHAGCGILSYFVTLQLTGRKGIALLTALLSAMTMVKADAVLMIAHRTTLLGALFSLASLLGYTRLLISGWNWKDAVLCSSSYLLGILSYETTLMLPAVFLGTGAILNGGAYFHKKNQLVLALSLLAISGSLVIGLGMVGGGPSEEVHGIIYRGWHIVRNILAVVPIFVIPPFLLHYDNSYHNIPMTYGWVEFVGTVLLVMLVWLGFRVKERAVLVGVFFFVIMAVPTTQVHWSYYPDFTSAGEFMKMRWSVGKFSYLSSFGIYMAFGILLSRLYCFLKGRAGAIPLRWGAGLLLLVYIVFNAYWLQKREQTWEDLTMIGRIQIQAIIDKNIEITAGTTVFQYNLAYYHRHAEALFRVLYQNPELKVLDFRDWHPGGPANNLFIIDQGKMGFPNVSVFSLPSNASAPKFQ